MSVVIPDQILTQSGLSSNELLLKVALLLFKEEKLTLGQASRLAGLHQMEFQRELANAGIPIHYGKEDLDRDLKTLGLKK